MDIGIPLHSLFLHNPHCCHFFRISSAVAIIFSSPDDVTTNGDRGNKLFGNVSGGTESLASSLCNNMLGGWYDNSYFEPLDSVKGDVARICLYVYVRYGSTYSECSDITNVFKDTDTLLEWMAMDPVDTWPSST